MLTFDWSTEAMTISSDALAILILLVLFVMFDVASLLWSADSREPHSVLSC